MSELEVTPDLVAVGASAGGIDALLTLLDLRLARALPFAVVVVLHQLATAESRLPQVIAQRVQLPVAEAQPHEPVLPGRVYLAPAGYHLLVESDHSFSLSCDAPVLYSRPSIDVFFESCAEAYGPAAAGILMTGANDDGARGLQAIGEAGGVTLVQAPDEAAYDAMPRAAIKLREPDRVLGLAGLRSTLAGWAGASA